MSTVITSFIIGRIVGMKFMEEQAINAIKEAEKIATDFMTNILESSIKTIDTLQVSNKDLKNYIDNIIKGEENDK